MVQKRSYLFLLHHVVAVLCGLMYYTVKRAFLLNLLKSSIPSHGMDASKNQSYDGIDFSQGIDSVESMPEVSLKVKKFWLRKKSQYFPC